MAATEWTSQAVRGSATAFAGVYERHHRALYRYCRALLGDDEEARDALQSTMTKAFAALRFEERDFELRPWLFRIAHNEAVSRLRQRRDAIDLDLVRTLATDSLAQTVEDRERIAQLRADLRELPERQRAALVMRELSGLGHAEIAAVLGGSPGTVKQTIFAARAALHECAEGRAMLCAEVQRVLSDGDGRVLRSRRMRAHVRACRSCREFKAALAGRPKDLAALAPGPPAAACATWLARLLASAGGSGAGAVATKVAAVVVATATLAGATTAARSVTREPARASASPAPLRVHRPPTRAAGVRSRTAVAVEPRARARTRLAAGGHRVHHEARVARGGSTKTAAAPPSAVGSSSSSPPPAQPVSDPAPANGPTAPAPNAPDRSDTSKRDTHDSHVPASPGAAKRTAHDARAPADPGADAPGGSGGSDHGSQPPGRAVGKPDTPGSAGRGTPPAAPTAGPPGAAVADDKASAAAPASAHKEK